MTLSLNARTAEYDVDPIFLERWSPQGVDIVDPASGRRRLSAAAFEAAFTGVVMTFAPGIDFRSGFRNLSNSRLYFIGSILVMPVQ